MKVRSKFKVGIMAVVAVFILVACAGVPVTQKGKYALALEEFTAVVTSYNSQYAVQSDVTKANWKSTIDPIFIKANLALDAWGAVIGTGAEVDKQAAYTQAFSQLKALLITFKIIEIKE